jgi:hypothetical protein
LSSRAACSAYALDQAFLFSSDSPSAADRNLGHRVIMLEVMLKKEHYFLVIDLDRKPGGPV